MHLKGTINNDESVYEYLQHRCIIHFIGHKPIKDRWEWIMLTHTERSRYFFGKDYRGSRILFFFLKNHNFRDIQIDWIWVTYQEVYLRGRILIPWDDNNNISHTNTSLEITEYSSFSKMILIKSSFLRSKLTHLRQRK